MLRREMTEQDTKMRKEESLKVKEIQKQDLCPTCYNMEFGGIYESYENRLLYEDEIVVCFLEKYPRSPGHTIIIVKEHFEDISEMSEDAGAHVMKIVKVLVNALKKVLDAEKVYMCTMCDGGRNHLHFQLIPRDKNSIIGSNVFVKERGVCIEDKETVELLRKTINEIKSNI